MSPSSRFGNWVKVDWVIAAVIVLLGSVTGNAQWIKVKTPGVPRTADGKPNLKAPVPRAGDRPDLSGLWRFDSDPYTSNVTVDLTPGEIDPQAVAIYKQRMEDLGKDDPATFRCLPQGPRALFAPPTWVRIIQTPSSIAMLYDDLTYRLIFTDGRALPKDPNPAYMGYSVGRWEGATLVIDSIGFNDASWLDFGGHPHTEALRMTERITRENFGRLKVDVRIDDPALYKRAFTVPVHAEFVADTEPIEYVCSENQKDIGHLVGTASDEKKFAVSVAPAILSKYVGSYTFKAPDDPNQVMHFNITLKGDTLSMDIGGKDPQEMIALSDKTFSMMGIRIDFETDHLIFHIVEGDMKATKDK
jgi:hypothetical protein